MDELGGRLRAAREAAGLSQHQLAQRSGVTQAQISRLESGKRAKIGVTTLRSLERGLGLSPGALEPSEPDPSLQRFLASEIAQELALTDDEINALLHARWYSDAEAPTVRAWALFVEARRALKKKEGTR